MSTSASPQLLVAALSGLLCMASCSLEDPRTTTTTGGQPAVSGSGGAGDTAAAGAEATSESPNGGASGAAAAGLGGAMDSAGGVDAAGAPPLTGAGGAAAGADGVGGDGGSAIVTPGAAGAGGAAAQGHITSSTTVADMTVEKFTALCDERGGVVEVMAHCNGLATAKGFSYDSTISVMSEHTCKGANTCTGWNCILD